MAGPSNNSHNRGSSNNNAGGWDSTRLLHVSDGKELQVGHGDCKTSCQKASFWLSLLFSRAIKRIRPSTPPPSTPPQKTIEDTPEVQPPEIHPVEMTKILREVFQDPQMAHKYTKHLDEKVQAGSSVSVELEVNPNPEDLQIPPN